MLSIILVLAICSVAVVTSNKDEVDNSPCPLWTYRDNDTGNCQCGTTANGIIECNKTTGELSLHLCVCLTSDVSRNKSIVGYCSYSCVLNYYQPIHRLDMYTSNSTAICNQFKREGPLCSKCIPNYGLPVYTYDLQCVKCPRFEIKLLLRFLIISLLPPTLLFIIVTIFHLNALRPPWSVFALMAQVISAPIALQSGLNLRTNEKEHIYVKIMATLYGPWNLDFFRAIYTPQCISPHNTILQCYVIDLLLCLYPLLLIFLLYIIVTLRDRGCRIALMIHYVFSRFRGTFNLKTSLIETFSTFFILAYMKTGFAALCILSANKVWSPDGSYVWTVYSDPSLAYFGFPHIVYALPTLVLAAVLVIFPIFLLLFYPYQWFQRFLHHLRLRSLALNTFVDAFQGCYKDGTDGTRDCRCFAAFQLLLRVTVPVAFFTTKTPFLSIFISSIVLGSYLTVFILMKPYKKEIYNKTDIPILMLLLLLPVDINASVLLKVYKFYYISWLSPSIIVMCVILPFVYLFAWPLLHVKPFIMHRLRPLCCRRRNIPEMEQLLRGD